MPRLPARFAELILCFAPLFFQRSWRRAELLLFGAILAPGQRTVTSIRRITGLTHGRRFANCHRILNRTAWAGGLPPTTGSTTSTTSAATTSPRAVPGRERACLRVWADITGVAAAA
jgi:hypothetical protein